jgi:uncharacterized protein
MTDRPGPLSLPYPLPSQAVPTLPAGPPIKDEVAPEVETVEEEPYTIKCICNFSDDDGNTILCETCDTWQHIDCFYPDNREEALRPDFVHSCAECKPRPLNRQKAIERTLQLKHPPLIEGPSEKKHKRPPSKSHKKKPKLSEVQINGQHGPAENGIKIISTDQPPPPKKSKSSHRSSQSVSSLPVKRSPSHGNPRANPTHPQSPATTPPDLPDHFQIHKYSDAFCSLYNEPNSLETSTNAFTSLAIPTSLSLWLREPGTMKEEVGRSHAEVFQHLPNDFESKKPKLEVEDASKPIDTNTVLRWRSLKSTTPIEKDLPLIELNGLIGFQKDYCADPANFWADLSSPLPFVFFHPMLPLYIDTRKEGSLARYVRRSCKPNAQVDTYLVGGSEYHFWLVSDRHIDASEEITIPWEFRLDKSVRPRWLHLLGLSDEDSAGIDEPEMDETEYQLISNWIDRILSEYGGCACDQENNCAFARFHRKYLWARNISQAGGSKKKPSRKTRPHTVSPTSTGPATNSRAASEGHVEEGLDDDDRSQSGSSRSKPPSRDPTPLRQGSFDQLGIITGLTDRDKRKVAMVEDSFRRMELQQQPPRKKKRASDGTTIPSSAKPKQRHGSTTSQGQYVDAGTCRSKSNSPMTTHSPQFSTASTTSPILGEVLRPSSAGSRPVYCDVGVQTDPVQGEWFSDFGSSPKPRKKIIPLSRRLLSSRYTLRRDEQDHRKHPLTPRTSSGSAIEPDSPSNCTKPSLVSPGDAETVATSQSGDVLMVDAPTESSPNGGISAKTPVKTPDLRVQMPPVPTFDNTTSTNNAHTPLSATESMVHSPFSGAAPPTPMGQTLLNGMSAQPSPAKKKLSLSDYTKRKAAGKVVGGNAILKPTLPSPEETKVDITLDAHMEAKPEGILDTTPSTNGHL